MLPNHRLWSPLAALSLVLAQTPSAVAYDVNDKLSLSAMVAVGGQCIEGTDALDGSCRGALPVQASVSFKPTHHDEIILKLGATGGEALSTISPFALSTWAADMERDLKRINGRDTNYVLEARYAHTFEFSEGHSLELTGGIIDSTAFVNANAFANDEYTQFMNEVFVNAHSASLPSYDLGGAFVWTLKDWSFTGVGMNVGENDEGRNYSHYAVELGFHPKGAFGAGNYRLLYTSTTKDFSDVGCETGERLSGWHLSFDQELGSVFGVFLRAGWQTDDALVDYDAEYSVGLNIAGRAWGREADNIGVGLAYLEGGNDTLSRTQVAEVYYRFVVNEHVALTADAQYLEDDYREGDDADGWVLGMRVVAQF
jgi:hypothetical protein